MSQKIPKLSVYMFQKTLAFGGVPPIGYELDIKPLIGEDLMAYQEIWAAAGTPNSVFRLFPNDLLEITHAETVILRK